MNTQPHLPEGFYATARGRLAARLVRERLGRLWPSAAGLAVLGVGYPLPYLRLWQPAARLCLAAVTTAPPPAAWPPDPPSRTCAVDDGRLPFGDLLFDRVLLVHGVEVAAHGPRLLREVWRVLRDDGRLIVVAPNRRGAWAHLESTPFGQGQPFSRGQIDRLLAAHAFRVEQRDAALFVPPLPGGLVLGGARACEATGRAVLPQFGGVTITEAVKDMFAAIPLLPGAPARVRLPRRVMVEAA